MFPFVGLRLLHNVSTDLWYLMCTFDTVCFTVSLDDEDISGVEFEQTSASEGRPQRQGASSSNSAHYDEGEEDSDDLPVAIGMRPTSSGPSGRPSSALLSDMHRSPPSANRRPSSASFEQGAAGMRSMSTSSIARSGGGDTSEQASDDASDAGSVVCLRWISSCSCRKEFVAHLDVVSMCYRFCLLLCELQSHDGSVRQVLHTRLTRRLLRTESCSAQHPRLRSWSRSRHPDR